MQVALLSKHAIIIADGKLKNSTTIHETIRVKSAAWSDTGVLIYTTLNHIKYCLPHGDSGIVRTLENPVYVVSVVGDVIHALDREGKTATIKVRSTPLTAGLAPLTPLAAGLAVLDATDGWLGAAPLTAGLAPP